jgi:radical SAM-linked protein
MAYTKKREARYIAHLDLARVFDRAIRRAQIEVAYSEGFNPHPKISFGPPLPVGVEGQREFVDIDLKRPPILLRSFFLKIPSGKCKSNCRKG